MKKPKLEVIIKGRPLTDIFSRKFIKEHQLKSMVLYNNDVIIIKPYAMYGDCIEIGKQLEFSEIRYVEYKRLRTYHIEVECKPRGSADEKTKANT